MATTHTVSDYEDGICIENEACTCAYGRDHARYEAPEPRSIADIAREIEATWKPQVSRAARPYVDAMKDVLRLSDMYYSDPADSLVRYFLSNATTWRGEDAKRIKAELKAMLKEHDKKRR